MNSKMVAAVSLGLAVGLMASLFLRQPEAQGQVSQQKQGWEYKVVAFEAAGTLNQHLDEQTLEINSLAAQRWEYVGLLCAGPSPSVRQFSGAPLRPSGLVLFRRPKR